MGLFNFFKKHDEKLQPGQLIIDVTDADFERRVIQQSYRTPVLVDFWATWCAACQVLDPILEGLANDADGAFLLAKLDTENNQRTAKKYYVQGLPAVKLFRNGQVVDHFQGGRPGGLVKRWVDKALQQPAPPPKLSGNPDPDQRLAEARQHLAKGRGFEAFVLLDNFPEGPEQEEALKLLPVARLLFDMELGDALTGNTKLDNAYGAVAKSLQKRKYDTALEQLATIEGIAGDENVIGVPEMKEGIIALRDGR